jgi:hypothetical protein
VTTPIKSIERYAFRKTFYRVGRRYRTYRTYTEDEVRAALGPAGRIEHGCSWQEPLVVIDGSIVTARYRSTSKRMRSDLCDWSRMRG